MESLPDIRQLRIFIALEQTRSFTAAAKRVQVTQSAVSHSIKSLEKQLGSPLIERLGKKCILTPYGEVFLHHAKRARHELESSVIKIETLQKWGYQAVRAGATDSICQYVLPTTMLEFRRDQPRCEVSVSPGNTIRLLTLLDAGKIDLGIGMESAAVSTDFIFTPLVSDHLCFIVPPDHPWAEAPPQTKEDYGRVDYIIYGRVSETVTILRRFLAEEGIKQRASMAIGNMEAIKEMTKLGMGVGVVAPWVAARELAEGSLVKIEIDPAPRRRWGYYRRRTKTLSLPEEHFLSLLRQRMEAIMS
ncbi:MAG: LysR family transcriptional regulator [Verrucomicrobiales bacterium]